VQPAVARCGSILAKPPSQAATDCIGDDVKGKRYLAHFPSAGRAATEGVTVT
jgi:hypothetical protein